MAMRERNGGLVTNEMYSQEKWGWKKICRDGVEALIPCSEFGKIIDWVLLESSSDYIQN